MERLSESSEDAISRARGPPAARGETSSRANATASCVTAATAYGLLLFLQIFPRNWPIPPDPLFGAVLALCVRMTSEQLQHLPTTGDLAATRCGEGWGSNPFVGHSVWTALATSSMVQLVGRPSTIGRRRCE